MITEQNFLELDQATLTKLKAERNAKIAEAFKQTNSIHKTRALFNFVYSRDVVRKAISQAGLYSKCIREKMIIEKSKNHVKTKKYDDRTKSKKYKIELELQQAIEQTLTHNFIKFYAEAIIPGTKMRADFIGTNWLIETKIHMDSQSLLTAITQCEIYARELDKEFKALVIPDDIYPTVFFKREYNKRGIRIIKFKNLIKWIDQINNDRR